MCRLHYIFWTRSRSVWAPLADAKLFPRESLSAEAQKGTKKHNVTVIKVIK